MIHNNHDNWLETEWTIKMNGDWMVFMAHHNQHHEKRDQRIRVL